MTSKRDIDYLVRKGIALQTFTVYENPLDYPGKWVARRWVIVPGNNEPIPDKEPIAVCNTIHDVREAIMRSSPTVTRLNATVGDDPCIVEVWL